MNREQLRLILEEVLVDGLDKECLAKLIEKLFDKHNENKGDYETGYAINLIA